jgi:2-polyprenyl-6-hydroxyphenyl methylase/3-demethylubiquinone-9 3-methyltransferase
LARVGCTQELKRRYFPNGSWAVEQGSVLDAAYLDRLGKWDVVYSWGVLHHTGAMWKALDLASRVVDRSGTLFIAIYNDQGVVSRLWTLVKRLYNSGVIGRSIVLAIFVPWWVIKGVLVDLIRLKNPLVRYREYRRMRGMSALVDWKDWLGGYPFEVATPDAIVEFFRERGFSLTRLLRRGGHGCNEFVFTRLAPPPGS